MMKDYKVTGFFHLDKNRTFKIILNFKVITLLPVNGTHFQHFASLLVDIDILAAIMNYWRRNTTRYVCLFFYQCRFLALGI